MPVARFLLGSSPISVLYGFPSYDIVEPEDEDVGETFAILLLMAFSQADQVIGPSTSLQHALEDHGTKEIHFCNDIYSVKLYQTPLLL